MKHKFQVGESVFIIHGPETGKLVKIIDTQPALIYKTQDNNGKTQFFSEISLRKSLS